MSCSQCKRARDVLLRAIEADRVEREICKCGDTATQWDYDQMQAFCDRHVEQADFTVPFSALPPRKVRPLTSGETDLERTKRDMRAAIANQEKRIADDAALCAAVREGERKRIAAWLRAQGIIPGAFAECIERGDHK